jgi:hypothetical protein
MWHSSDLVTAIWRPFARKNIRSRSTSTGCGCAAFAREKAKMNQYLRQPSRLMFDQEQVRRAIRKNQAISYGLTFVAGLPFPPDIYNRVALIQRQIDALAPGRFFWYDSHHLHVTLAAPLRGRYRDHPALQREELPADLQDFVADLASFFARQPPFSIELGQANITPDGAVVVDAASGGPLARQLATVLRGYPALDQPKHEGGLHLSIGYLNTVRSSAAGDENSHLEEGLSQLANVPLGRMVVHQIWLVHYANRTLNRIVGETAYTLGQTREVEVKQWLRELSIP